MNVAARQIPFIGLAKREEQIVIDKQRVKCDT